MSRPKRTWTEQELALVRTYPGHSITEIAASIGVSIALVREKLRGYGVRILRGPRPHAVMIKEVIQPDPVATEIPPNTLAE
jgi:hypothetical protein